MVAKKYKHSNQRYKVYTKRNPVMRLRAFIELYGVDIEIRLPPVTTAASSPLECQEKNMISWDYILEFQDDNGNILITKDVKDTISNLLTQVELIDDVTLVKIRELQGKKD